jgi:DNA polymerase III gamma/tau subunit
MPLSVDYRPRTLDEFFGNESIKESLKSILAREDKPKTYLFSGPSGCGKTTLARIVSTMLGCNDMDLAQYNISDMRGIDTARDIIASCQFEPLYGDVRVIILNECHKSTADFQNAMLEILEEPPRGVYFILCTTEPEKLLKTIKTRATTYNVSTLRKHELINLISWVLTSENVQLSEKVKSAILFSAEGCARKALVILDQIIDIQEEEKQLEAINENTPDEVEIINFCRKIMAKEPNANRWKDLSIMIKGINTDPEGVRRAVLGYLSSVLLNGDHKNGERIVRLIAEFSNNYYDSGKAGLIASTYMATLI